MMKTRISLALGFVIALTPASVAAQVASPAPGVDEALVNQLCAAGTADAAELAACMTAVETALAQMIEEAPAEEQSLLDQAQSIVDDTADLVGDAIDQAREIDLQEALDGVVESAQEFDIEVDIDVQGALDEVAAAVEGLGAEIEELDIQSAIDEAVAEALAAAEDIDLEAAVDEALAEVQAAIEEADLQGTVDEAVAALEESVEEARAVVAAGQEWARENESAVCRGGSVSLGTTVGIAVFAMTGVEWLGLQAFWATERFTNTVCGDIVE